MLTDNAGEGRVGRVMGLSMSIVLSGTVGGPSLAGILLQWAGYWPAWSVPFAIILVNILLRLITDEPPKKPTSHPSASRENPSTDEQDCSARDIENTETSPLLSESAIPRETTCQDEHKATDTPISFYYEMLSDCRVLASISSTTIYSIIIAGFNTTLPVHLREIFNWGSFTVGMMFLILRIPAIILGPLMGWVRDHIGLRYPTTLGWALLSPLILCLGLPSGPEHHGKAFFITCLACIGCASTLVQGAGVLHTISEYNTWL